MYVLYAKHINQHSAVSYRVCVSGTEAFSVTCDTKSDLCFHSAAGGK